MRRDIIFEIAVQAGPREGARDPAAGERDRRVGQLCPDVDAA